MLSSARWHWHIFLGWLTPWCQDGCHNCKHHMMMANLNIRKCGFSSCFFKCKMKSFPGPLPPSKQNPPHDWTEQYNMPVLLHLWRDQLPQLVTRQVHLWKHNNAKHSIADANWVCDTEFSEGNALGRKGSTKPASPHSRLRRVSLGIRGLHTCSEKATVLQIPKMCTSVTPVFNSCSSSYYWPWE